MVYQCPFMLVRNFRRITRSFLNDLFIVWTNKSTFSYWRNYSSLTESSLYSFQILLIILILRVLSLHSRSTQERSCLWLKCSSNNAWLKPLQCMQKIPWNFVTFTQTSRVTTSWIQSLSVKWEHIVHNVACMDPINPKVGACSLSDSYSSLETLFVSQLNSQASLGLQANNPSSNLVAMESSSTSVSLLSHVLFGSRLGDYSSYWFVGHLMTKRI